MRTGGKLWSLPSRAIGARPTPSRRQQPVGYFVHERQHSLTRICYVQRAQDMQICFPFTPFCFRYFTYLYELILLFPRFRCFRTRSYFPLRTLFPTRIPAYRFTVLSLLILPSSFRHRTYYCACYLSLVYQDPKAQFPHGLVLILTPPTCIGFRCIALTTRI